MSDDFPFKTEMIDPSGRVLTVCTQVKLPEFEVYKIGDERWVCSECGNTVGVELVKFTALGGDPEEPVVFYWFSCRNGCIPKPPAKAKRRIMIVTKQVCSLSIRSS